MRLWIHVYTEPERPSGRGRAAVSYKLPISGAHIDDTVPVSRADFRAWAFLLDHPTYSDRERKPALGGMTRVWGDVDRR